MGTVIRPELSTKNPYWIEKHRYYELKHFCLQYPAWKKAYASLNGLTIRPKDLTMFGTSRAHDDPTARCAIAKAFYSERMDMIQKVAEQADPEIGNYIMKAVTEGLSYETLKTRLEIPCSKDTYYNRYRKFFWLLNKERN